ncbi:hypothetical protein OIDMADRAFT_159444 [Oidiodendron maius Zn]|uniref:Sodium/calcium exchanger membrane region domain-containing protein n=1 Tax=Oidiodendron maius (strain Zn) TaxID=913774 RepID=A0A0C3DQ65_OIDMZ|nr:hypothetical protein OIDMADRAFT_159444 [Oidiodendron maius Zn]
MRDISSKAAHARRARRNYSFRAFYITVLIISSLAIISVVINQGAVYRYRVQSRAIERRSPGQLSRTLSERQEDKECRLVHHASDQCAFIRANCEDEEAGMLSYLTLYYCTLQKAQPVAFIILTFWLALLFTTIGIAASDFFCINLSTIASILGMSESMAGVTFLAFGNGSPDVFSTFAAMNSNSGSLAVGELVGAAGFITAVVAGSMALVREFKVGKKSFVRDVGFFIVAASFSMVFLADGALYIWECCTMIAFYLFYVVIVVVWHWYLGRRRLRREREAAARGQFLAVANEELEVTEEDNDDEDVPANHRPYSDTEDFGALERASTPAFGSTAGDESDENEDRETHLAAEMASNMRITRPRGSRRHTLTPIRPSLVGALEFRSVLSSLQKSRSTHGRPIYLRRYSDEATATATATPIKPRALDLLGEAAESRSILSAAAAPRSPALSISPPPSTNGPSVEPSPISSPKRRTYDSSLAPPGSSFPGAALLRIHSPGGFERTSGTSDEQSKQRSRPPQRPTLQIPGASSRDSSHSRTISPVLEFPRYTDSPLPMSHRGSSAPSLMLPHSTPTSELLYNSHTLGYEEIPVKWWPYRFLPSPYTLLSTLFPTLYTWHEKSVWDKFVSVISAPSIFLLAISLPVVESEDKEDEEEMVLDDRRQSMIRSRRGTTPMLVPDSPSFEQEPEWLRYRGSTTSHDLRESPRPRGHSTADVAIAAEIHHHHPHLGQIPPKHPSIGRTERRPSEPSPATQKDWNRWLIAVQIFTAPLFVVIIAWANTEDRNSRLLVKLILYSLLGSLITLGILILTTTHSNPPKYRFLFCFVGFVVSIAWISTIANEVVGVLKAIGVILGISDAILGLTIFAVGNSLGDLVADITVARLGYPVMALSACFGGPMLNILLGIGISGLYMTIKEANTKRSSHPEKAFRYKPYHIEVSGTLIVSAITLLVTLTGLLITVPLNKWMMSRRIGWGLIVLWSVSTIVNLAVEISGGWGSHLFL